MAAACRSCCKISVFASMPDYFRQNEAILQLKLDWKPNAAGDRRATLNRLTNLEKACRVARPFQCDVRGRACALPTLPVARPPPMMCHSDDFEFPVTNAIDKTVGKVRKEIPTCPMHVTWPALRIFSYAFHADVDFRRKGAGSIWTPLRIPLHRGFHLGNRCRMKANPNVRHPYAA
jgi:hypothetical protein